MQAKVKKKTHSYLGTENICYFYHFLYIYASTSGPRLLGISVL
jgi:hypothetical protein